MSVFAFTSLAEQFSSYNVSAFYIDFGHACISRFDSFAWFGVYFLCNLFPKYCKPFLPHSLILGINPLLINFIFFQMQCLNCKSIKVVQFSNLGVLY